MSKGGRTGERVMIIISFNLKFDRYDLDEKLSIYWTQVKRQLTPQDQIKRSQLARETYDLYLLDSGNLE